MVNWCNCIGDFELDIIVGFCGYSKVVLLILIDCKLCFFWVYWLKNWIVVIVNEVLNKFLVIFNGLVYSFMVDCGIEFSGLVLFEV